MDYPAYVPPAVRTEISSLIEGRYEGGGLAGLLANAQEEVVNIDRSIEERMQGPISYMRSLRQQKDAAVKRREKWAAALECVHRLAKEERMREVYAILAQEFLTDQQQRDFVYDAWAAYMEYELYRGGLKGAKELRDDIADTSEKLAKLLRDTQGIVYSHWPEEFFSIDALLEKTDNYENEGKDLNMWRAMRHNALGFPLLGGIQENAREQPQEEIASARKASAALRYAWTIAPPLSALLETMTKVARDFKPNEYGMIGAALVTRQRSLKNEYLRAFGYLLTNENHVPLTVPMMHAMAIVANVVINLPDVDASFDDVRKALAKLRNEPPETSGEAEPTLNNADFRPG